MEIEYVVMDYEGKPVSIEDGEICEEDPPRASSEVQEYSWNLLYKEWDSDKCEWVDPDISDMCGNDARDYGTGWYDCNTDWHRW